MNAPRLAPDREKQLKVLLQDEVDGVALYGALAKLAESAELSEVFQRMADTEGRHAARWQGELEAAGARVAPRRTSFRTRALIFLAKRLGPEWVLPTITEQERADASRYDADAATSALGGEERSHALLLSEIARSETKGLSGEWIARFEGRHRASGGNALRAAVLGANDGLLSNLSLVMGVAGAEAADSSLLVTGLAGLLAGAGSMALGEWLSVQSSRELYTHQIETERAELEASPAEEEEELALIYRSRGLSEESAKQVASRLLANKDTALEVLAREELGVDPKELGGSAWVAAGMSFALFAFGASIPVLPFVFLDGRTAILTSLGASACGLFGIGAMITIVTGRSAWFSGLRQLAIGLVAAGITWLAGHAIGRALTP